MGPMYMPLPALLIQSSLQAEVSPAVLSCRSRSKYTDCQFSTTLGLQIAKNRSYIYMDIYIYIETI